MLIKILWSSYGYTDKQRSVQFVMSKSSVVMADMESKFKSPLHGDNNNVWMVISRGSNRFLDKLRYRDPEKNLKKLLTNACRTRIKSNRLFNWKCQTITFRFLNECGKTSLPTSSVTDTRGNPRSLKLSVNWYDMKIIETEKQMEQFIGN